jgi:predicted amidohydrolase
VRALLGQIPIAPADPARNVATVVQAIESAPDAALAVFPELAVSGYDLDRVEALAVVERDPLLDPVRDAARRTGTAVVLGFAELRGDHIANSLACIGEDGEWLATYRKVQLFGEEDQVFCVGEELLVVELAGMRVAPLVCFDMEFPELARAAAAAGAELLVTAAANMAPYGPDHALAAAARALDNRLPHLYVNRTGTEGGLEFVGGSTALRADGSVITRLGAAPDAAVCELSARSLTADTDYLGLLRPTPQVRSVRSTVLEGLSS